LAGEIDMASSNSVVREGITAGLLGAIGVAIWFFGVDLIAGQPLYTPSLLGRALLSVLGHGIQHGVLFNVAAYTVFHFVSFMLVGFVLSKIVDISHRVPQVSVGFVLFFVVFEVGFYGLAALISQSELIGRLAWYQVGAANLLASALMGGYMWRKHPELGSTLGSALDGSV
jgi:hypothetical protein